MLFPLIRKIAITTGPSRLRTTVSADGGKAFGELGKGITIDADRAVPQPAWPSKHHEAAQCCFCPVKKTCSRMTSPLLDCPPTEPDRPVTYAGHREYQTYRERLAGGVPLDELLFDSLAALGRRLGVGAPPFAAPAVKTGGIQP